MAESPDDRKSLKWLEDEMVRELAKIAFDLPLCNDRTTIARIHSIAASIVERGKSMGMEFINDGHLVPIVFPRTGHLEIVTAPTTVGELHDLAEVYVNQGHSLAEVYDAILASWDYIEPHWKEHGSFQP